MKAQAIIIMDCSNCGHGIEKCDGCGKAFEADEEIECKLCKHYCKECKPH